MHRLRPPRGATVWRAARAAFACFGAAAAVVLCWLALGLPLVFDRWLDVAEAPAPADAIVCIGGGTALPNLPTAAGWERIYTTVQLFAHHYAPVVVFTGGGPTRFSEAESYAEAATWLGLNREVILLDPVPNSTAEHPQSLLAIGGGRFTHRSRLLIVTSRAHSRRVLLVFQKQGYTDVRVVSEFRPPSGVAARDLKISAFAHFEPSRKSYEDVFSQLRDGSARLVSAVREMTALAWYWWKGLV